MDRHHPTWSEVRDFVVSDLDAGMAHSIGLSIIKTARGLSAGKRRQLVADLDRELGQS